jgi:hypothetical protein
MRTSTTSPERSGRSSATNIRSCSAGTPANGEGRLGALQAKRIDDVHGRSPEGAGPQAWMPPTTRHAHPIPVVVHFFSEPASGTYENRILMFRT